MSSGLRQDRAAAACSRGCQHISAVALVRHFAGDSLVAKYAYIGHHHTDWVASSHAACKKCKECVADNCYDCYSHRDVRNITSTGARMNQCVTVNAWALVTRQKYSTMVMSVQSAQSTQTTLDNVQ